MVTSTQTGTPLQWGSSLVNGSQLNSGQVGLSQTNLDMGTSVSGTSNNLPGVQVNAPNVPGGVNTGAQTGGSNFWSKDGGAGLILGGVQVLGNLWSSFQAHKMAKEQMAFAREQWDTNLANQTQTYNTALEDRIRGRYAAGDRTEAELQGEIDRHSL